MGYYLEYYKNLFSLDYATLRYRNVYSPRQDSVGEAGVIASFTEKLLQNQSPTIFGSCQQTKVFICLRDIDSANYLVVKTKIVKLLI